MSFLDNENQMVVDAIIQELSEQLFEDWHNANLDEVYEIAKDNNVEYNFILEDTTKVKIEPTELLFIDTDHTYEHLKKELSLHSSKVSKWIII